MMSLPVEDLSRADLDWSVEEFPSESNDTFRKLNFLAHTKIPSWIDFRILFSKNNGQKPWIMVNGNEKFHASLQGLDLLMKEKLESQQRFKYFPWINTEYPNIRFHLTRLLDNGPFFIDIVENECSKRIFGIEPIFERLCKQPQYARLEFEFFYTCTDPDRNVIHCTPRLKRIFIEK